MDFGVGYFPTHDGMNPGAVVKMIEETNPSKRMQLLRERVEAMR